MFKPFLSIICFFYVLNAQMALPYFSAVQKYHPTPDPENPLGSNIVLQQLNINQSYNYMLGYRFTPQVDGKITQLGGFFNNTSTVRLWHRSSREFLGSVTVTSNNSWSYTDLSSPISVSSGEEYTVAIYLNGSGGTRMMN